MRMQRQGCDCRGNESPQKMANMMLVLQFGTAEEKAMVMKDIMMDLSSVNNAEIESDE